MKDLIKCHLNYLISKTTIIISIVVILIIIIGSLSSVFVLDSYIGYLDNNYIYFYNVFVVLKIIIIIFAVFLYGYSFLKKSDQYVVILIASGISRKKIIFSKILAISLVVFLICYFAYFQYVLIGCIKFKSFIFKSEYLVAYISLFLLTCFFGLLSTLLVLRFDNIYIIIIPFALMNINEIINEDTNIFVRIINFIIPYFSDKLTFFYGYVHVIIMISILFVVSISYYEAMDI